MTDRSERIPSASTRIRNIAQGMLNADLTVAQLTTVIQELGDVLGDFDSRLDTMASTMAKVETSVDRMDLLLDRAEVLVGRMEKIAAVVETALLPALSVESGVRRIVGRVVR